MGRLEEQRSTSAQDTKATTTNTSEDIEMNETYQTGAALKPIGLSAELKQKFESRAE